MPTVNCGNPVARARAGESWLVKAAVASVLGASMVPSLHAQDASASAEDVGEVVVTGSRISRRDNTADSPIVTLTAEALQNTSEVGVEQSLNKMPQFVPGQNQFSDATLMRPSRRARAPASRPRTCAASAPTARWCCSTAAARSRQTPAWSST